MKIRNTSYDRPLAVIKGRVSAKRAGTAGVTFLDAEGNDVTSPDAQFVGATVSGEDGELAIITINGTGQQATNNSGQDLNYGDVVILDTDGTIVTTTTAQDTRPVGVIQVGGTDGSQVHVVFSGYVAQVNTTGDVVAGDYLETAATAGTAQANASRRTGSFAKALADGPNPPALMAGWPDTTAAPGSGTDPGDFITQDAADDRYLTRATGERHVPSTATAGETQALDLASANTFDVTLTDDCTISLTNPPDSGVEGRWTIALRQDSTGGWTVTWPAAVVWRDTDGTQTATPPTLATAAGAVDTIDVRTLDGGATYGASIENGSNGASGGGRWEHAVITGSPPDNLYADGDWLYIEVPI